MNKHTLIHIQKRTLEWVVNSILGIQNYSELSSSWLVYFLVFERTTPEEFSHNIDPYPFFFYLHPFISRTTIQWKGKKQVCSWMAVWCCKHGTPFVHTHIFLEECSRTSRIPASSKAANPRVWNMAIFLNKLLYFDQEPFVWETLLTWKNDFYITNIAKYLSNKHRMAYWKSGIPYI